MQNATQDRTQDRAVFRSQRRRQGRVCPPDDATLMRIETALREALTAQSLLADRIEQVEFSLGHFLDGEDGVLTRLARVEARLAQLGAALDSPAEEPVSVRLDRLSDMLATLSTRLVQVTASPTDAYEVADDYYEVPEDDGVADLDMLPGIGPGLIRMLQKAGLTRIDELACADAARLREALGPVGDVLDTGFLVARARDQIEAQIEAQQPMRAVG